MSFFWLLLAWGSVTKGFLSVLQKKKKGGNNKQNNNKTKTSNNKLKQQQQIAGFHVFAFCFLGGWGSEVWLEELTSMSLRRARLVAPVTPKAPLRFIGPLGENRT